MLDVRFTSLKAERLSGVVRRTSDAAPPSSADAVAGAAPATLRVRDARRTLLFGPSHLADRTAVAAQDHAAIGAFSLFLPRRVDRLHLDFYSGVDALTITLESNLEGVLTVVDETRAGADALSDGFAATVLSALFEALIDPSFSSRSIEIETDLDQQRDRMQIFFDATAAAAPFEGVATLLDYAQRFGPTAFLYEKTSFALLRREAYGRAVALCDAGLASFGEAPGLHLHKAVALEQLGRLSESAPHYVSAAVAGGGAAAMVAAGRAAWRLGHGDFGATPPDPAAAAQAIGLFRAASAADPTGEAAYRSGAVLASERRFAAAKTALDGAADTAFAAQATALRAEIALIEGDLEAAAAAVAALDAGATSARLAEALAQARALEGGGDDAAVEADPTMAWGGAEAERAAMLAAVGPLALHAAGGVELKIGGESRRFRRAFLDERERADAARRSTVLPLDWRAAEETSALPKDAPSKENRSVVLASPKGAFPFGGAERFLLSAAAIYAEQGYSVSFVGFEPPEQDYDFAYPTRFVSPEREPLRAALLSETPAFVHAISGALAPVAAALRGTAVPLVKGLHFWSEIFHPRFLAERAVYAGDGAEADANAIALLFGNGPVYANSPFLRAVARDRFGYAPPAIPSVELEPVGAPMSSAPEEGRYALLLDGRAAKGGAFVLEIARRLPERLFVIVCPQSAREAIEAGVVADRLENVAVLGRVDDVDALLAEAAVVLAPSYDFVETFGRVPIEAARRGRPSIVADVGHLPSLVADRSCVLPQDAGAWAARIERFFVEPPATVAPPESVAPERAKALLQSLAPAAETRTAALLGPGEAGVAAAASALDRLADHLGAPVDVIASDCFEDAARIFDDSPAVSSVLALGPAARAKPYRRIVAFPTAPAALGAFFAETVTRLVDAPVASLNAAADEATRLRLAVDRAIALGAS